MKKALISFALCMVIGFGLGYLVFGVIMGEPQAEQKAAAKTETTTNTEKVSDAKAAAPAETVSAASQDNILSQRGCLGCHSVEALNLKGGQVGPDLSHAYLEVADKHGMPIEQFLTKPNSAVMSGVLGSKPLTDDQRKQVIELLKKASEAN